MLNKLNNLINFILENFIKNIDGNVGVILRRKYYRKRFGSCGNNLRISKGVSFEGIKNIHIGNDVWIDNYCLLIAGKVDLEGHKVKYIDNKEYLFNEGELHIGSNSHIAPQSIIQSHGGVSIGDYFTASAGTKIYSLSNDSKECHYGTYSSKEKGYIISPISISTNVWLGLNVVVLGGDIKRDSFVATNSVILKNIDVNSYVSGNPGVRIKNRFK